MKTEMKGGMKAEMDRTRTADGPEMKSGKWKRKWNGHESGTESENGSGNGPEMKVEMKAGNGREMEAEKGRT